MSTLSYLPKTESQRRVSLQEIDSVVMTRLGPTRGLGKSQPACFNRQISMYLASHVGRWSTTSIGRFYGGRDHSTVVHSIQRIQRLRISNPEIEALLTELRIRLDNEPQQASYRVGSIRGVNVNPDWELIADRIVLRVREFLREELRALLHEQGVLVQPGAQEPRCNFSDFRSCEGRKQLIG